VRKQIQDAAVATKVRTLALLEEQERDLRAELLKLRAQLMELEREADGKRALDLQAANEQLVLAALHADSIAEEAVKNLAELAHSSQRDGLTDTPNRALMLDRVETAIASAKRRGTRLAVVFLDLDHFKRINDTLGHAVGDEVLRLTARRLESVVRHSDTVSRHGGDEFVLLLTDVAKDSDVALIASKILAALAQPNPPGLPVDGLSASLGISTYPEDGDDAATLISRADVAMYFSKNNGAGGFAFYSAPGSNEARAQSAPNLAPRVNRSESVVMREEPRLRYLREANESLVLAALSAQELEARAQESHRRQVKFIAMVAHELRNPLNPIRMAASLLERAGTDHPLLARLQGMIEHQVAHMSRLVDDLLDGSRISTGKLRLEWTDIDLNTVLGLAIDACQPGIDARLQRLTRTTPRQPLAAQGDPVRLAQVFINLLENASKYSPDHGEILLSVQADAQEIAIHVSDKGVGISPEDLPHIFDLYVQDPRALERKNDGLGLGLAIVREVVQAHGGTVVALSAGVELGSEFIVRLPREAPVVAPAAP